MKTRNKWTLALLVLVVVACVGWFVVSFTYTESYSESHSVGFEVILYGDQDLEHLFASARATAHRLGYKTADGTSGFSSDAKSSMSLKAIHEDGIVLEIDVDSKADGPSRLRIRLTEQRVRLTKKREGLSVQNVITVIDGPSLDSIHETIDRTPLDGSMDAIDPLQERARRILKAIRASLESP